VCKNPSTGHFSRRIREKNKKKKEEALYVTYLARCALAADFGVCVCLMDIIKGAKMYRNWLKGLDLVDGRISTIPIGMRYQC